MSVGQSAIQQQVHALYSHHHGWLYGWLRRKLGCSHQAADLAHDTFLRLLTRRDALALDELREPRAYLTTVAKGLVSNHYRRQKLELAWAEALASMPEPLAPAPEVRAMLLETLIEVDRLLGTLPGPVREAFLLSQLDGLPQAEIAARLGVSVPSVKRYVARALALCCFADEG